jgi:very-short-patch-repair endonuclease
MPVLRTYNANDKSNVKRRNPEIAIKRQGDLVKTMTAAERQMVAWLYETKHKFKVQEIFVFDNFYYIADFWLPKCRIILELDGQHHYCDWVQEDYDCKRDNRLRKHNRGNIEVIRVPNDCVSNTKFQESLLMFLDRRKANIALWAKRLGKETRNRKRAQIIEVPPTSKKER